MPASLDVAMVVDSPPSAFPNGCHICEVEIDPETGAVEVAKYTMVDDFGVIVNPLMVEGQVHGGVTQGIGQALLEAVRYDSDGQLQTGSFMDYAMPRAERRPQFQVRQPSGAGEEQCTRRQGLRRSGLFGLSAGGDERGGRRAFGLWHPSHRHARDAAIGSGKPFNAHVSPRSVVYQIPGIDSSLWAQTRECALDA